MTSQEENSIAPIEVNISGHESLQPEGQKKSVTVYEINVSQGDQAWTISRRYNEFFNLRYQLKKACPEVSKIKFPGKTLITNKQSATLDKRQGQLKLWLQQVLQVPEILGSIDLLLFLEAIPAIGINGTWVLQENQGFTDEVMNDGNEPVLAAILQLDGCRFQKLKKALNAKTTQSVYLRRSHSENVLKLETTISGHMRLTEELQLGGLPVTLDDSSGAIFQTVCMINDEGHLVVRKATMAYDLQCTLLLDEGDENLMRMRYQAKTGESTFEVSRLFSRSHFCSSPSQQARRQAAACED